MVLCRPSSNFVFAVKPNSVSAFEVSNILRGWPSGFVASHLISSFQFCLPRRWSYLLFYQWDEKVVCYLWFYLIRDLKTAS
jgi:hypothetical protein